MKICLCTGSVGFTDQPSVELSVGTSRQPMMRMPSLGGLLRIDVHDLLAQGVVVRQEQRADRVLAGRRQREAELRQLLGEELVRDLHQDAGAVAGARVGADRAAVFEVEQDRQRVAARSGATCGP